MTACSQRQKASMLVEDYLEEALPYPDSYEAIDIYVDSAFAPYDDRKAFEMLNIIGELAEDLENTEKEARQAKASIAMWSRAGSEYELMLRKEAEENLVLSIYKIDSLKKLQDDIAYEITQVVSKANVISEILYSISYEDNAPVDVSEFLLDNEIYTLDNFDLESYINWEIYEDALNDLKKERTEC